MRDDILAVGRCKLRATDSNSLLRMYDLMNDIFATSRSQLERVRADKAVQRICQELQKRNVPFGQPTGI